MNKRTQAVPKSSVQFAPRSPNVQKKKEKKRQKNKKQKKQKKQGREVGKVSSKTQSVESEPNAQHDRLAKHPPPQAELSIAHHTHAHGREYHIRCVCVWVGD